MDKDETPSVIDEEYDNDNEDKQTAGANDVTPTGIEMTNVLCGDGESLDDHFCEKNEIPANFLYLINTVSSDGSEAAVLTESDEDQKRPNFPSLSKDSVEAVELSLPVDEKELELCLDLNSGKYEPLHMPSVPITNLNFPAINNTIEVKMPEISCNSDNVSEVTLESAIAPEQKLKLTSNDEEETLLEELCSELENGNVKFCGNYSSLPNGLSETALLKLQPIHQKLQEEMITLQKKCKHQAEQISRLHRENQRLCEEVADKTQTPPEIYEVQMEALEKTISSLQRDVASWQDKLASHDEVAKKTIGQLKQELGMKLDKMTTMYEAANKDKEMTVIKYAHGQKEILTLKKLQDDLEKKLRESAKDREMLFVKLKNMNVERTRLCHSLDIKLAEVNNLQREGEKMKEQISSKDIKIKWAQNKLRMEMDAHKETELKLERLQQKLQQTREEAEQIRKDCQEMIRTYQDSEEVRSNSLDIQLKEKETELEMERQEKNDQEEVYHSMKHELDSVKKKHKLCIEENNNLTMKVQSLERERLEYENNLSRLKDTINVHKQETVDYVAKLAEMDNMTNMLEREKEKCLTNQTEIERLRQANNELLVDMDACRAKEGELLEFTERITSKNVMLQSEFAILESKNQMLEQELNRLTKLTDDVEKQISISKSHLEEEKQLRHHETQLLARKLAEKTKIVDNLNLKLDDEVNETRVIKRKHAASVKELTRELQQLKRKLEMSESTNSINSNHLEIGHGMGSRVSSSGSLDTGGVGGAFTGVNNPTMSSNGGGHGRTMAQVTSPVMDNVITVEPSRQLLIERIVKLQKSLARKNEKIEFLDEHVTQIITELRKKSRIIQGYVMKLETGALATEKMDQNKMDLTRRGGIMASVYSSHATDGAMTLDLSLEINQKLQAVLEDTLLKNITLKENINTLGNEIARLSKLQQTL